MNGTAPLGGTIMRYKLATWAARYIGLPWALGGRDDRGLDCWGLVRLVLEREFGVALDSYDGLDWRKTDHSATVATLTAAELDNWIALEAGWERPADVIMLRIGGHPLHVAVVAGGGYMLHIERGIETCLERYGGIAWRDRVCGCYRHRALR